MAVPSGTRLGPYEILAPIGAGGMGEVYRGRDTRLGRTVAIKILPAQLADSERRERFVREARAVSAVSHPHICALYDVGQQDGTNYLVMEYLEGETLAARIAKGPLSRESLIQCALQISQALAHAHREGVLHRDLKPANIMITREGVKLLDFGLAKLSQPAQLSDPHSELPTLSHELTQKGVILGTLPYMAPEQLEGKPADARADIFSFGAVLYEMATAQKAFPGQSAASVIAAVLEREPPSLPN
jgi:eukaryotic-like serine/threonine-protein kinase